MEILKAAVHNKRLLRYFAMAVVIVAMEIALFQLLFVLGTPYLYATAISFIFAVILNWIGGRIFIFGKSKYHPFKEFSLVLIASIVGLFIQMMVVYTSVELLMLYPLFGKVISILFSFFWNYFFRAKFVYRISNVG